MGRTKRIRTQRQRLALEQEQTKDEHFLPDLYKYLSSLGWKNETKLTARNFLLTGRGLCSKSVAIEKEADIIRLPLKALLTIKTLEQDEDFKNLFDKEKFDKEHKISFQSLMAFYVLHQKLLMEESKHKSYIKSLPNYFTTPYFCPVAELQCLPDSILERTVEQNRKIKESYQNLKLVYNFEDFDSKYSLKDFRWSYFVVNTRSVYIFSRLIKPDKCFFQPLIAEDCNLALAPFLDLFNHSDLYQTQADLIRNPSTKQFEFILTLENCPSGKILPLQQVFISYGALTNLKLLIEYGFILPSNQNDYFEISLNDIETFLQQEKSFKGFIFHRNKFKFIREHNLNDQMFIHKEEGISHNLHVVLHLLFKEESYFPNILNQVAFGSADNLLNVDKEVEVLLKFKIKEYEEFVKTLDSKENLTKSGLVCNQYLKECLAYLTNCLINLQST
ncbi:SET domain-containing protein 4 [Lucilia sericata]|uniref:SET domain-containing protein 4 n=1 Tax=Lucilia sericata TaxID=13632 RepID=UPI0018A849DE|nr:SET domain-containing protein 4 [Lucilia sericata]